MKKEYLCIPIAVFMIQCPPCDSIFIIPLIIPEDVATGSAGIYGFSPRLVTGADNRFGFGFRFGNHADLQVLYELGPQAYTKPLQPVRIRSATYRERIVRRRPIIDFLLRVGFLKETSYNFNVVHDVLDEPR